MKLPLIPLASPLSNERTIAEIISRVRFQLGEELRFLNFFPLLVDPPNKLSFDGPVILFLITGGTEKTGAAIEAREYILLAHPAMNSLPAALELRTYLEARKKRVQIVTLEELKKLTPIKVKVEEALSKFISARLALIGEPASWLVGSQVDEEKLRQKWNISVERVSLEWLVQSWSDSQHAQDLGIYLTCPWKGIEKSDFPKVLKLSALIENLVKKENYSGVALSCFDLLSQTGQTGCLALANLNNSGVPAACEGDLPSLLTMLLLSSLSGKPTFMGNPAWIEKDQIVLAHCTVAPKLTKQLSLSTHFESGKSIAIEGTILPGIYTIGKIAPSLDGIFFSAVQTLPWQKRDDLCRTQISLKLSEAEALLHLPLANHLVLAWGDLTQELKAVSENMGLKILGCF